MVAAAIDDGRGQQCALFAGLVGGIAAQEESEYWLCFIRRRCLVPIFLQNDHYTIFVYI